MPKRKQKRGPAPTLADRLGWPRCRGCGRGKVITNPKETRRLWWQTLNGNAVSVQRGGLPFRIATVPGQS